MKKTIVILNLFFACALHAQDTTHVVANANLNNNTTTVRCTVIVDGKSELVFKTFPGILTFEVAKEKMAAYIKTWNK